MLFNKGRTPDIGSAGLGLTDSDVEEIVRMLDALPPVQRSSRAMHVASRLLEYAAFELAGHQPATFVAELVDVSAEIEKASAKVLNEHNSPQHCRLARLQ